MKVTKHILPPVANADGLQRPDSIDWAEIHAQVQSVLQILDDRVRQLYGDVRITFGANSTRAWNLFTYRVYAPVPEANIDSVCVGLMFGPDSIISSDIVGETLGDILFEANVPETNEEADLISAARSRALILTQQAETIASALQNTQRQI